MDLSTSTEDDISHCRKGQACDAAYCERQSWSLFCKVVQKQVTHADLDCIESEQEGKNECDPDGDDQSL